MDDTFAALRIDDASGVPVWVQIRDAMLVMIRSGKLYPDYVLPTVRTLAADLGVSYNTVHKAYQSLEDEGLIAAGRGRRSTITAEAPSLVFEPSPLDAVAEAFVDTAHELGVSQQEAVDRLVALFDARR